MTVSRLGAIMSNEALIQPYVSETSLERGEDYYRTGAVGRVVKAGTQLFSEVQGSYFYPYQVCVTLDEDNPVEASCTCPYDWGGYCKHIVAVFLTYVLDKDVVETGPSVDERLASLEANELRELIGNLIERQPGLLWLLHGFPQPAYPDVASEGDGIGQETD